jgi:3-deoxy-D-manno-octulosonic-acid transferase
VRPIWIHAASGEFEYAKSVIRELKKRHAETPVLVTYFSPTYAHAACGFEGVDLAMPLPIDLPGPCRSFLKKYRPQRLLIARTDFWPEMLSQCRAMQIPTSVFAYTQKSGSGLFQKLFKRWILGHVDEIFCVSEIDRLNTLQILPSARVEVLGDTRYDQVAFRLSHPKRLKVKIEQSIAYFVAGSTWSQDEEVLLPSLADFLKSERLRLVLVPHEPTQNHLNELEARIKDLGLTCQKWSQVDEWTTEVLVVDQVGVLAELYLGASWAFVGGSFRKSVHSVMEALGAGCRTFVGPYYQNNREAIEFSTLRLAGQPGLQVVHSKEELEQEMQKELEQPEELNRFKKALSSEFHHRLNATNRLLERLGIRPQEPDLSL